MRHAVGGEVGVILRNYEFAPLADMAVVEVALLAENYAVLQRIIPTQFSRLFEVGEARSYLQFFTTARADLLLPDIGPIFYILRKFLGTHSLRYSLIGQALSNLSIMHTLFQ